MKNTTSKISKNNTFRCTIAILMVSCFFLFVFHIPAALAERSFQINTIQFDTELLPDASMQVTQHLTVDFSGQWNGFSVKIPLDQTQITEAAVSENGQPYQFTPGSDYGPAGSYIVEDNGDSIRIHWSISASDEQRSFDISYRVLNAVMVHNDTAELYRKFIGDGNKQAINNVMVRMQLPPGAENYQIGTDIRAWGHGPLDGEVLFDGPQKITWQIDKLPDHTFLEGRVTMPTALFPNAPPESLTGTDSLQQILKEEKGWAADANRQRTLAKLQILLSILLFLSTLAATYFLWRKYGRKYPTEFNGDYYRELPASYSPPELGVLWNYGEPKARDLTATILDLARRKYLVIEEEKVEKKGLFRKREENGYRLTLQPDSNKNNNNKLRNHEKKLLNFLFKEISDNKEYLYLHDIEDYAKKKKNSFYSFWLKWKDSVEISSKKLNFFEKPNGKMRLLTVLIALALGITGLFRIGSNQAILGLTMVISALILGIIPQFFKRRSQKGQEDLVRWQAFRRFLLHFSEMPRHEIPSLIIWEYYLVYAVSLGVAKEVIKQLPIVFPNMQEGDYRFGYGWYALGATGLMHMNDNMQSFMDSLEHSIENVEKTINAAGSSSSSDSGEGGGFSSGGGGGSGGSDYGGD